MVSTVPLMYPEDFPPMLLNYPMTGSMLPDLMHAWHFHLCSARLRDAMALPPGVAQYLPVDVRAPDPRVHAMDYKALHILAYQPVIDLERSDVTIELKPDRHTGGTYPRFSFSRRWAIRAGFQPQTDLFRSSEDVFAVFVTDALAERVMAAGCPWLCLRASGRSELQRRLATDHPHRPRHRTRRPQSPPRPSAPGQTRTGAAAGEHTRLIRRREQLTAFAATRPPTASAASMETFPQAEPLPPLPPMTDPSPICQT